jgi:hypothetical protein
VHAFLPPSARAAIGDVVPYLLQFGLLMLLLRVSPVAGFHAAEHQVVHALERSEPLLIETVRQMPRVHPRCGTNLVAGMMIVVTGFLLFDALLPSPWGEVGVALSFLVALVYWRALGGWLQQHFTTRKPTDAQVESGIRAARELLAQHGRDPFAPPRPAARLWRMGLLQILAGFFAGYGLLWFLFQAMPGLRAALGPLADVLTF